MATAKPVRFTSAEAARRYLEKLLWREGPVCPHCRVAGQATALKGKSTRPGVYWCNACRKPFSATEAAMNNAAASRKTMVSWVRFPRIRDIFF